jgi:hypothetical protein
MTRTTILRVVLWGTVAAIGAVLLGVLTAGPDRTPGDDAVYQQISGETNCAALRRQADTYTAQLAYGEQGGRGFDVTVAYLNATGERRDALHC